MKHDDFIIGNGTNVNATENETLERHTISQPNDFESFVDSASQNRVIEKNIDDKIRKAVNNAVTSVENRMHDAILAGLDKAVIPGVEMALRSITGSSGHGPNGEVQNSHRTDFLGNAGNTPLMSASGRLDLNINQDRKDETRNEENFEDGDFPM